MRHTEQRQAVMLDVLKLRLPVMLEHELQRLGRVGLAAGVAMRQHRRHQHLAPRFCQQRAAFFLLRLRRQFVGELLARLRTAEPPEQVVEALLDLLAFLERQLALGHGRIDAIANAHLRQASTTSPACPERPAS